MAHFDEMDLFLADLANGRIQGRKVFVSMGIGIRIFNLLPNGQMERTIEESHLVPSSPYDTSTIYILPGPTDAYESLPYDEEVQPRYFGHAIMAIDNRHGIQSVKAFAAHPNGTDPLTPDLLPRQLLTMYENDFTLWFTLTFSDGTSPKTIKCGPSP